MHNDILGRTIARYIHDGGHPLHRLKDIIMVPLVIVTRITKKVQIQRRPSLLAHTHTQAILIGQPSLVIRSCMHDEAKTSSRDLQQRRACMCQEKT